MKKSIFLLFFFALALASFRVPVIYPLDNLPSPQFAYGLRRLSGSYQGSFVLTLGDKVAKWYDQAGNPANLEQTTSTWQPLKKGNAVYLDGVDDFLYYPSGFQANQLTLVAAVAIDNPYQDNPIINLAYPYSPNNYQAQLRNTGAISGSTIFGFVYGGQQVGWSYPSPAAIVIVSYVADEATGLYKFRLNGVEMDTEQQSGNWSDPGNLNGLYVGRLLNGEHFYGGFVYELYGWSVVLTDEQLAALEQNVANFVGCNLCLEQ